MKSQRGFTLVEMAIVVFLIGMTMSMGLKMVTATLDNGAYSETKSKQERIKIALIGYLRTNGSLPCPDSADNSTIASGSAVPCTASASTGYGVVPWGTLGLSRDTVQDGWGNYFTYRVANGVSAKNWTSRTAVGSTTPFDINELTTSTDALIIQELNPTETALVSTTTKAVVVILSHGKNGFGAKTVKVAARMTTTGAGTNEVTNATIGSATYIRRPVAENTAATGGAYDDVVAYMTPQDLLQPLVTEGTLKACIAYCPSPPSTSNCTAPPVSCTCLYGAGVAGTPASGVVCTGECTTCTAPAITAPCTASGIPIGNTTITCP